MTTPHKLSIIQPQDRVVRIQKVGVKHDFDVICGVVEQFDVSDLIQDGVGRVVSHTVSRHRRQQVALEREYTVFQ